MKIGIIIAMDIEYRKLCEALGGTAQGIIGGNEVVLWQCGIGKVNAAVGTLRLIQEHRPDVILSTGLAGGIDNCLSVMDVVIGAQAAYHDVWCGMGNEYGQVQGLPARFDADARLLKVARETGDGAHVKEGLLCTGDQFITDREALAVIKSKFPDGLACEMESAAIAHTCHLMGVPFMSIRVISDTPGNTDNHQMQWDEFLASMSDRSFQFVRQFLGNLPNQL
ncbi:MAG: 5'-methylthioadenosine/adenosylhomocysteine nucleosidase [Bacteroidales bacterium]|nr:5'-methylthioadenosine/adenosylhomocysteine nucleosidase [Bacteroidales bacterium]